MTIMPPDAAVYFQAHYVLWVLGVLEPEICKELNDMSPPGTENWIQIMERTSPWPREQLQRRFMSLCEKVTDDEALDILFGEIGFPKS